MRFQSILIVTYGRSGSTLLQGILNALPNVQIRGENYDFCWGLYLSWKSLVAAKSRFGTDKTMQPTSAWFGACDLNPELFLKQARELLRSQLSVSDDRCWGFKEIRYVEHLNELHQYLDFLTQLLPKVAIIFNTRSLDDVCQSAFWKKHDPTKLKAILQQADRLFLEYTERHENAFVLRYERMILGLPGLKHLLSFLGTTADESKLDEVLSRKHSFIAKEGTLSHSKGLREALRDNLLCVEPKDFPCKFDSQSGSKTNAGKVLVASIVKNERARLPYFLSYYRDLGIL